MDDPQPRPSSSTSNRNGEKRHGHGKYYAGRKSTDGKINNGRKSASATCIVQTEKMHQNVDLQRPSSSSSAEKIVEIREQQRQEIAAAEPSNKHRHPHPMYLKRKREIDEQFEAAKKRLDTLRDLRMHSLARCMQAEREAARQQCAEQIVRQQCAEQIELKFEQLEAQEREVKAIMRKEFRLMDRAKKDANGGRNLRGRGKMRPYLEEIEKSSSNASRKRQNNSNNNKDQQAEAPKFKWRNIPVMIAKLPAKAIDSDLATLFGSPSSSSSTAATVTYDAVDQPSTSSSANNNPFINPEVEVS